MACWATTSWAPALSLTSSIRLGAGAFVCGEETALMTSIEGNSGEPQTPSAVPGRQGSVCQAHAAQQRGDLRQHHAKSSTTARSWFASMGTEKSPRAPRSLLWAARSSTPAWWKSPWAPPCAPSSTRSAAAAPTARSSRLPRPAVLRAAASPCEHFDTHIDFEYAGCHRFHDGFRRSDCHGRGQLHGRYRQVLPRVHR